LYYTLIFFTSFCNGTTATCAGLSQWGTVGLANSGLTPIQILRRFYPSNIEIVESNIFMGITETFPGQPLRLGDRGLNVQIMQRFLNRIRRNYPLIPVIAQENGVFGQDTANAVRIFQQVFKLAQDGVIGKATWNKISYIYVAVARLAELDSEGTTFTIGTAPPNVTLRTGARGHDVLTLQYILSFISQYYPVVAPPILDGIFGTGTARSVIEFQRMMGLSQDGIVMQI
jgi:peptidoglycan hydrolase-like protein with peptidoglycan-binding domain